jgi:hypothetical protein
MLGLYIYIYIYIYIYMYICFKRKNLKNNSLLLQPLSEFYFAIWSLYIQPMLTRDFSQRLIPNTRNFVELMKILVT